jgi:hypothetical protein
LKTFADIVEDVTQLSPEKEELHDFLQKYLIEESRRETLENADLSLHEYGYSKLQCFTDVAQMMDYLSN